MTPDETTHLLEEELHQEVREWVPLARSRADELHIGRFLISHDDPADWTRSSPSRNS